MYRLVSRQIDEINDVRYSQILRLRYLEGRRLEDISCIMVRADGAVYSFEYIKRLHGYALAAFGARFKKNLGNLCDVT